MPWKPGESGNPRGRVSGAQTIAARIRHYMGEDLDELVKFAVDVFRDPRTPLKDRLVVHDWLSDRAAGKAPQVIEADVVAHDGDSPYAGVDMSKLDDRELEQMGRLLTKARGALPAHEPAPLEPVTDGDDDTLEHLAEVASRR